MLVVAQAFLLKVGGDTYPSEVESLGQLAVQDCCTAQEKLDVQVVHVCDTCKLCTFMHKCGITGRADMDSSCSSL